MTEKPKVVNRNHKLKKWTWQCPVKGCEGHGHKPLSRARAGIVGRGHLAHNHSIHDMDIIYIPILRD